MTHKNTNKCFFCILRYYFRCATLFSNGKLTKWDAVFNHRRQFMQMSRLSIWYFHSWMFHANAKIDKRNSFSDEYAKRIDCLPISWKPVSIAIEFEHISVYMWNNISFVNKANQSHSAFELVHHIEAEQTLHDVNLLVQMKKLIAMRPKRNQL